MAMPKWLIRLFAESLEGYEPRIVDLERSIRIIGMAADTNMDRIYRDVPALGKAFRDHKRQHPIPGCKEPWGFAAVSTGFNPAVGSFTYTIGDVVNSMKDIPEGLIGFEIPAGRYAVFPVRPKNRFGWGPAIADAKQYAYGIWLPQSGYATGGVIDDFEYHDERSLRKRRPEIDLYVAIKEKP
ncbi:MAG: GyrI-like domain-containing protein [Anaerolineales bacterium]